jgi:hypothetical protein
MRSALAALVAVTLSGTLACSALDPPTAPSAAMLMAPKAAAPSRQFDPLNISGSWVTSAFNIWSTLPGSTDLVHCESYAYIENDEWNSVLLKQEGTRIVGTSRPGMGISCYALTPDDTFVAWYVDINDAFEGQVTGDEVSLSLNKSVQVRVKPDGGGGWGGTIRVRMDPRPYAEPYWVAQPFGLWTTNDYPCWWVHLRPPYCIDFP